MQQLKFVGVDDDHLVLVDEAGDQYTVGLTAELRQAIRTTRPAPANSRNPLPSPREVQTQLRSGLTADQVAQHYGVDVEYVEKFEAPVVAELEHIVDQARQVPLHFNEEGHETSTFGHIIVHRLVSRQAEGTRWSSWREEDGRWTVQIEWAVSGQRYDARWFFDPRRRQLTPANEAANDLSQAQDLQPVKAPRLRVVDAATKVDTFPLEAEAEATPEPRVEQPTARETAHSSQTSHSAATADEPAERPRVHSETEDLLQALRRHHEAKHEAAPLRVVPVTQNEQNDSPKAAAESDAHEQPHAPAGGEQSSSSARRGRSSLPSWDEIVFGTKAPGDDV